MKIHHLFAILLCSWACLLFSPVAALSDTPPRNQQEETYRQLETFANILSILQENYVEKIETRDAIDGAINGLLLSLDPHSSYLKPESYREFRDETEGSFTGIGIEITLEDGVITVISPIAGTPADRAGIKARDRIVKIDGESTKNKTPLDAVKLLRGPKGSEVTISIFREGEKELLEVTLVRDTIPLHSVESMLLRDGFGYIRITNFQKNTTSEFREHFQKLSEPGPLDGLLLDLRNNPGGLLNQAVSVTDLFLTSGLIVYTRGRIKEQDLTFDASDSDFTIDCPLVVLVNEGSASASEIVAGAVQDHHRGIIVGTKTFGKGSVQTIIPLPDGAGLRMTTARYYTPDGRSIQATGILPDVVVKLEPPGTGEKKNDQKPAPDFFREADLQNHMDGQPDQAGPDNPELTEEARNKLAEDNQLRSGFNILKSLVLYAGYLSQEQSPTAH